MWSFTNTVTGKYIECTELDYLLLRVSETCDFKLSMEDIPALMIHGYVESRLLTEDGQQQTVIIAHSGQAYRGR